MRKQNSMKELTGKAVNTRGQALVELAIVLLLLLLLVLGIFEFGRAMYIKNTLTHAARAGARTAVVTPDLAPLTSNTGCTNSSPVFQTTCQNLYTSIDKKNITVLVEVFTPGETTTKTTNAQFGDIVRVTVTLTGFTSFVPNFVPVPTTLAGNTAMRYE